LIETDESGRKKKMRVERVWDGVLPPHKQKVIFKVLLFSEASLIYVAVE
jgi:hypothetical protein